MHHASTRRECSVGRGSDAPTALTSSKAIAAFLELLATWKLAPARGWRMLTGLGYRAGSLTPDQIARVSDPIVAENSKRALTAAVLVRAG